MPGERADLLVTLDGAPGSRAVLQSLPYARGKMVSAEQRHPESLLTVHYQPAAASKRPPLPAPAVRRFVQRLPGDRLFHCHILEHEDLGMMATLRVAG